jgi:predicted ATPase
MSFIKSFTISTKKVNPFPFNVPAVKFAKNISLSKGVTIFVGDNGSGKSTLLESIALSVPLPLIGGHILSRAGFDAARVLQRDLDIEWLHETAKGFFFRAEDFSDFLTSVEKEQEKHRADFRRDMEDENHQVIEKMAESANHALRNMRKEYGGDMQGMSHGEAYLKIFENRIKDKGIFILDEPEAALSPLKQLSLITMIKGLVEKGNTQFILATHSPILMGIPGATLYEISDTSMKAVDFEDTEHYQITKTFLDNPDTYLRHL